ncbi:MAG: hypothetical protein ACAI34_07180, partial [Verrucomicrobium sp.]
MRSPYYCWFAVAFFSSTLLPAQMPPAEVLQRAKALAGEGQKSDADSYIKSLLSKHPENVALWEEGIRAQAQWGSLKEAFWHARRLNLRMQLGEGTATPLPLYLEMRAGIELELDDILKWVSLPEVNRRRPSYESEVVELLKLTAAFYPDKSAKVIRHLFGLSQPAIQGKMPVDHAAAVLLAELGHVPETFMTVMELAEQAGLTSQREWCVLYADKIVAFPAWDRPGTLSAFLTRSPLTASSGLFRDLELPKRPEGTLLGAFTAELRKDHRTAWRWEAVQVLKAQQSATFGGSLLLHLLEAHDDLGELKQFLTDHKNDLANLSDKESGHVLTVLKSRYAILAASEPLEPELKNLLSPLLEAERWYLDGVRLEWKRTPRIEEMKISRGDARTLAVATLRRLMVHDPAMGREFLLDVVRLMKNTDSLEPVLLEAAQNPDLIATVLKLAASTRIAGDPEWEKRALLKSWQRDAIVDQPQSMISVLEASG